MDIYELKNKNIKISKNSITIKDESGKTCGVVRNITKLTDLPPRKVFEYHSKIKGFRNEVYIYDDEIIIFNNLSGLEGLKRLPELYEEEKRKMQERKKEMEKFATVIDVYL